MASPQQWWRKYGFFVLAAFVVVTLWGIASATLHGHGSSVEQVLHWLALSLGVVSVIAAARQMSTSAHRPLVSVSYLCLAVGMGALFIRTGSPQGPAYLALIANAAILASLALNWLQSSRARRDSTRTVG